MHRVLHTRPLEQVIKEAAQSYYALGQAHGYLVKEGQEPKVVHALSGELYLSDSGWLLLDVPNSLVRGAYDAINETGVELPINSHNKQLNAHITVMDKDEVAKIGADKINDRGRHFHYTLGPIKVVENPHGDSSASKVFYIMCKSNELRELRRSYGLSSNPKDNDYDFHITIGVVKKKVLQNSDVSKAASLIMPALRLGGLATDIAGLQAITGGHFKKKEDEDPAEIINKDTSYLDPVKALPTSVSDLTNKPVASRKRKVKVSYWHHVSNLLLGASNGLLESTDEAQDSGNEKTGAGHIGTGAEAPQTYGLPTSEGLRNATDSSAATCRRTKSGTCTDGIDAIIDYYRNTTSNNIENHEKQSVLRAEIREDDKKERQAEKMAEDGRERGRRVQLRGSTSADGEVSRRCSTRAYENNVTRGLLEQRLWDKQADGGFNNLWSRAICDAPVCHNEACTAKGNETTEKSATTKEVGSGRVGKGLGRIKAANILSAIEHAPMNAVHGIEIGVMNGIHGVENIASKGYHKLEHGAEQVYKKLEKRYGPRLAKAALALGAVGSLSPIPGTSLVAATPALAAGEVKHWFGGNYHKPRQQHEKVS